MGVGSFPGSYQRLVQGHIGAFSAAYVWRVYLRWGWGWGRSLGHTNDLYRGILGLSLLHTSGVLSAGSA